MNDPELIIFVGIPASGKSTYFRQRLAGRYLHVSLDNWRGKGNVRGKEKRAILEGLQRAIDEPALAGVVVDNTNTTRDTRQRYFDMAREFERDHPGRHVRVSACFFDSDLDSCLQRNRGRPSDSPPGEPYYVPPEAIMNFATRLEPPSLQEGFRLVLRVRPADGDFLVDRIEGEGPTQS